MANGDAGDIAAYSKAQQEVIRMLREIRLNGFARGKNFAVGRVEKRMQTHADSNNVTLASKSLYMGPKTLFHSIRPSKVAKGLAVPEYGIADFIRKRRQMDLYWDGDSYVYTDHIYKYVIHPNYKLKIDGRRIKKVSFVTAGLVTDDDDFENPKYTKL